MATGPLSLSITIDDFNSTINNCRMFLDKNFVNHSVVTAVKEITECPARGKDKPKFQGDGDTDNAIFQVIQEQIEQMFIDQ